MSALSLRCGLLYMKKNKKCLLLQIYTLIPVFCVYKEQCPSPGVEQFMNFIHLQS